MKTKCPKCGFSSGDDWSQCGGDCPMEGSPHFKKPKFKKWPSTTSPGDFKRVEIIKGIFQQDPDFVEWLFHPTKPELFADPDTVLKEAGAFSSGQQILIRVALAVWCWHEGANFVDICRRLDGKNFQAVLKAMVELRNL